jgi:hypothetical protein
MPQFDQIEQGLVGSLTPGSRGRWRLCGATGGSRHPSIPVRRVHPVQHAQQTGPLHHALGAAGLGVVV